MNVHLNTELILKHN